MIGVDTNVLLRAVVVDDQQQAERAQRFLVSRHRGSPAVINSVVLAEFVWSLRAHYGMPREEIASILRGMVDSQAYLFIDRDAVLDALHDYESNVGAFTDRLIAEINDRNGCSITVTFDEKAAKLSPFSPIP